jgi:hypothetical protein
MFRAIRTLTPAALVIAALASALPASASTISYDFTGACSDCYGGSGNAYGTLVLSATYTPGSPITTSNFVSFTYDGTNLLGPFTITNSSPDLSVSGSIPSVLPSAATVSIDAVVNETFLEFNTNTDGAWSVTNPPTDMGTLSSWSAVSTSAPEPGTSGLLGLGLIAALVLGRRRLTNRNATGF